MSSFTAIRWFGGISLAAALLFGPGIAWAQNPHFVSADDSINSDGALVASWKEAGLGNNQLITYELSADASATCNCVTKSGQCPSAANKQVITEPVSAMGTFSSGKNGQISQSLTAGPPTCGASSPPTCGGGQTFKLVSVTYANIELEDQTNQIFATTLQSPLSRTFFTCPNQ